ncbi:sensor histidine kinase [Nocardioides cheoyonin]|uniref:sensor histidine kinase n=1 Tax=Nocardioides cheoyonin TaxID=3156615 RepID=UPI0032B3B71D
MRGWLVRWIDVVLAVVVLVLSEVELFVDDLHPLGAAVPASAVAAASIAVRRRWPLVTVVCCFGGLVADTWAGVPLSDPVMPIFWVLAAEYSAARHLPWRGAIVGLLVGLAFFASTLPKDSSDLGFGTVLVTAPWLVGLAMRTRVAETETLADRAEELERRREEEVRAAGAAERARIARDLHDVIAHSVSVMVLQAAGAEQVIARDPARATDALQRIQDLGRGALTEIGALLGLLREHGEEIGMASHPGVGDLDALVDEARSAGLPVELRIEGVRRELPPGVSLSVYRVVQEALTNIRKHAGSAPAVVTLCFLPDEVRVLVVDSGSGAAAPGPGGRQGIVGMRERVAVYGGRLDAGPEPSGGYAVRARIPVVQP